MKTLPALLALALAPLSLACAVKLPGGLKVPGADKAAAASAGSGGLAATTTETAAETIGPSRKVDPKLVAYYQQLDHRALHKLLFDSRSDAVYEQAKADVGRDLLWQSGNPDPTWIKVWSTKDWSYASGNAETLMQAAFNRSWEAACKAEFAKTRAAHADLAARFAPQLAEVDGTANPYARRAGYVALAAGYEQAAADAGLDLRKDPFGPAGFRITILQHAIAWHAQSPRAYASFGWDDFARSEDMRERGRMITDDQAFELQAYCGVAADRGGFTVDSFGSYWGGGHMNNRNVAWPTVWGDQEAVAARAKQLVADTGATLTARDGLRIGSVPDLGSIDFAPEEPKLARASELVVDKVTPAGDGVKLALSRKRSESFAYACRETRQIDRIDDDGRIVYRTNCKYGDKTFTIKATVGFDVLPPGLALAKGDVLTFTGDVDADKNKKVKDTASKVDWVRTMSLTGRVLEKATRKGQPLF